VRTLRVGVYKARVIKAVEEAGSATGTRLPSLDLGAYSPEFRIPHADVAAVAAAPAEAAASVHLPQPSAGPHAPPHEPEPAHAPPPVTAKPGDRCSGCGGLASVEHLCGVPLCKTCVSQFPTCPKCGEKLTAESTRPIPGLSAAALSRAAHAPAASGPLSALRNVFHHREGKAVPEPPSAPAVASAVARSASPRHSPPHRPEHDHRSKGGTPAGAPAGPPSKPSAAEAPKPAEAPTHPPTPKPSAKEGESDGKEHGTSPAPSPARPKTPPDDEPRL